jgi:hypothetical protein
MYFVTFNYSFLPFNTPFFHNREMSDNPRNESQS